MQSKKEWRKEISSRKKGMSQQNRQVQSMDVIDQLLHSSAWRRARVVMAYYPLPDELDVRGIFSNLQGRRLVLPVVVGDEIQLKECINGQFREGAFHIMEPDTEEWFTDLASIDLIIVPGVAFTRDGHRLGRGKGYYDRFLTQVPQAYKLGVCFAEQLVDELPFEPYDIPMNSVLFPFTSFQIPDQS